MRLAKAMLIGSAMCAISASAALATMSLLDRSAAASVEAGADGAALRWVPPEPTTKSLAPVPISEANAGGDSVAAILFAGLLR